MESPLCCPPIDIFQENSPSSEIEKHPMVYSGFPCPSVVIIHDYNFVFD